MYSISFSNPHKTPIDVRDDSIVGPSTSTSALTLTFIGNGAAEWGEAVDENFIALLEHRAGGIVYPNPVEGQLWYSTKDIARVVPANGPSSWVRWNRGNRTWAGIQSVFETDSAPNGVARGTLWYNYTNDTLYVYESRSHLEAGSALEWLRCTFDTVTSIPNNAPKAEMLVWTGMKWSTLSGAFASTQQPPAAQSGELWFNPLSQTLHVFDMSSNSWQAVVLANGHSAMTADLQAGGHRLCGVADPIADTDLANKRYVDRAFVGAGDTFQTLLQQHEETATCHLAPSHNRLLDDIDVSVDDINAVAGVVGNVQAQIDTIAEKTKRVATVGLRRSGGVLIGPLSITAPVTHSKHAATKGYVANVAQVSQLQDVAVPAGGFADGDVLQYSSSLGGWHVAPKLDALQVEVLDATLESGQRTRIRAVVSTVDASGALTSTDVTSQCTWTFTPNVGSFDSSAASSVLNYAAPIISSSQAVVVAATYNGQGAVRTTTVPISVRQRVQAVSLTVNGPSSPVPGQLVSYTATTTLSDGSSFDVSANCSWRINGTLMVGSSFTVPSNVSGNATVQATYNYTPPAGAQYSGNAVVGSKTVAIGKVPVSIDIGAPAQVLEGTSGHAISALAHFNDGTTEVVTSQVTWTVNNGAVITGNTLSVPRVDADTIITLHCEYGSVYGSLDVLIKNVVPGSFARSVAGSYDIYIADGVTEIRVSGSGAGGGGGGSTDGGGDTNQYVSGGGAGGGAGASVHNQVFSVSPNSIVRVEIGKGGKGALSSIYTGSAADVGYAGSDGAPTILYIDNQAYILEGGKGGKGGYPQRNNGLLIRPDGGDGGVAGNFPGAVAGSAGSPGSYAGLIGTPDAGKGGDGGRGGLNDTSDPVISVAGKGATGPNANGGIAQGGSGGGGAGGGQGVGNYGGKASDGADGAILVEWGF